IFQLVTELLPVALVHFGTDALVAESLGEALVTAHAFDIAIHDGDENRSDHLILPELAEVLQRRHQARHADGKARGRNRLTHETRHETVVATTAADRAEHHLFALFIGNV